MTHTRTGSGILIAATLALTAAPLAGATGARKEALAKIPRTRPPEWYRLDIEGLRRRQAVHTLAGFVDDLEAGRKVKSSDLPPLVRDLYGKLQRSRVRVNEGPALPDRTAREWAVPFGDPTKVPRAWSAGRNDKAATAGSPLFASVAAKQTDLAAAADVPSDHPLIRGKAAALGNDPVRIYNFVHDEIATELYFGAKKGAVGALREGAANDMDQAVLLVTLLRAAGYGARFAFGLVALTDDQATTYAGAKGVSAATSLIGSAGIPISTSSAFGPGLKMQHTWVRAFVPTTAYRGVARPGSALGWVSLAPAIKTTRTQPAVDLRDAVQFDYAAYLAALTDKRPSEVFANQLRAHVKQQSIECDTLDSAQPLVEVVRKNYGVLPAELPVRLISFDSEQAEVPDAYEHKVHFRALGSQGGPSFTYEVSTASLWGKSATIVYEGATPADAMTISSHGGLEQTPAYLVKVRPVLRVDEERVAIGIVGDNPGRVHTLRVEIVSPVSVGQTVEHALTAGGVYAVSLDPGLVPAALIGERHERLGRLTGDDAVAEKLHISGLTYFRELGTARRQVAGLHWHRVFKEVEEALVSLDVRVNDHHGTPISIARSFFMLDAALIRSGNLSIDGDNRRRFTVAKLIGFESSFLEHRAGELFYGPRQFSAVKLLQQAGAANVRDITASNVEEALVDEIQWPIEFEDRIRDAVNRGLRVQAHTHARNEPGLGSLFGYVGVDPESGAGEYIVGFQTGTLNALVNGGIGEAGPAPTAGAPGCFTCGSNTPGSSTVHAGSGNYVHQVTDLSLPARGIPLVFTRTYSSFFGWRHNYEQRLEPQPDGSIRYIDETGVPRPFAKSSANPSLWLPPPMYFQVIESEAGGFRMTFKDGIVYRFDAQGRLLSQRDGNGHQVTLSYGGDGRLATVTGAGGSAFTLTYDGGGRLQRVRDSANREVTFTHTNGNLTVETDVLGKPRGYTYDGAGRMRSKSDFRGNLTIIDYDDLGRVVRFVDAEGGERTYAYDARYRRTLHTDRSGHSTLYELNADGQPTRIVDPLGNETVMTYDDRGSKTSEKDARGNETVFDHDENGNVVFRKDPLSAPVTYTYVGFSRLETVTDAAGVTTHTYDTNGNLRLTVDANQKSTSYTYTPDGLLFEITRPGNATTTFQYDPAGNVEFITDAEQAVTRLGYDGAGHLTSINEPGMPPRTMVVDAKGQVRTMRDGFGRETMFGYDDDGNRTSITDPNLAVTRFEYDKLSRLVVTFDALNRDTRQEYDREGRVVARIDARKNRTELRYDPLGRLAAIKDPLGNETTMGYCAELGQKPCVTVDPLGNATVITEDELGRETERIDPMGNVTVTKYDSLGRRESVTDPDNHTTTFGYDALGRLEIVEDALLNVTRYGYDDRGNRTSVTDANEHVTAFDYDRTNRLRFETNPLSTVTELRYDGAGNRRFKIDGKQQTTRFEYDANRRLTDLFYADGTQAHFEYDFTGNRTLERNADSERTMTYDALGRLETVTDVRSGRVITYGYDATGNRSLMRVMPDNHETRYSWDARGLLVKLTDPERGEYHFGYDKAGRRTSTTYPNGMSLTTTYDRASRVVSMVYRDHGRALIESFTYTYDKRGNRRSKVFANGTAEVYEYDALSRLTGVTYPSGRAVRYVYDAVGNRLEMIEGTASGGVGGGGGGACAGDADCDGVPDATDNCPAVHNTAQTDSDAPATPADLVAGYNLDEPTGSFTVRDVTGRSDGQVLPGPGHVPGKYGNGLEMIHTSPFPQAVKVPSTAALEFAGAQMSIAVWIRPREFTADGTLFTGGMIAHKPGRFALSWARTGAGAQIVFDPGGGATSTPANSITYDQWNHVAVTLGDGRLKMYINGLLVTDVARVGYVQPGTSALFLGCRSLDGANCAGVQYFGVMDEVGLWSRALTATEVQSVMNMPLSPMDLQGDVCDPCPTNPDRACVPRTCLDTDGDGYGVAGASSCGTAVVAKIDCNDTNPGIHPNAVEVCDSVDNDCDGQVDESCLSGAQRTVYAYNAFNQLLAAGPPVSCPGDSDCDGVADAADNCDFIANPAQANGDTTLTSANAAGARAVWGFEETSGNTVVDAMGTSNGAINGTVNRITGSPAGRAVHFAGTGYISAPVVTPTGPFTMETWAKIDNPNQIATLFNWGRMRLEARDGKLQISQPFMSAGEFPYGRWTHVAYTWDGTTSRLYIDDVQVGAFPDAPLTDNTPLHMGLAPFGLLDGAMDEPAIFPRALTAAELSQHAIQGLVGDRLGDACDACPNVADPACAPAACTDGDSDGYGPQGASMCGASSPDKFDCNDNDKWVRPGAFDTCDSVDNDCDGRIDEDCPTETTFSYDPNGNQVRKVDGSGTTEYTFDARDRLVEVKVGGSSVARYGYDTQNLRVAMEDAGGSRRVLLDGIEEYAEVDSSAGTMLVRYTHDVSRVDALLAQARGGVKAHAVTDALGSVYGLTDAEANAVTRYSYDVYGARTAEVEGVATSWGYTGRRHDGTGLNYNRARHWDVGTARWVAPDPIGITPSNHGGNSGPFVNPLYVYALNSPTRLTDPSGKFSISQHESLTEAAAYGVGFSTGFVFFAVRGNVDVDLDDQSSDYKHGMRESGGWFSEATSNLGGFLGIRFACANTIAPEDPFVAQLRATSWIQENVGQAYKSMCDQDPVAAATAIGRALHTVQDRRAHLDRETGLPATMYQHCRQRMDEGDYPHLWVADYEALNQSTRVLRILMVHARRVSRTPVWR